MRNSRLGINRIEFVNKVLDKFGGSIWEKQGLLRIYWNWVPDISMYIDMSLDKDFFVTGVDGHVWYKGSEKDPVYIKKYLQSSWDHIGDVKEFAMNLILKDTFSNIDEASGIAASDANLIDHDNG